MRLTAPLLYLTAGSLVLRDGKFLPVRGIFLGKRFPAKAKKYVVPTIDI
jgi:hypothetical protein